MNISVEDYLRTMYSLYEQLDDRSEGIRSSDIAASLKVSKPSVSSMMKKLVRKGYLKAEPYKRIHFTSKGLCEAERIMHNHRVIEVFLYNVLGCDKRRLHDEAHRLEHAFSQYVIDRLDRFLDNPKRSPLGEKIPH